MKRIVLIVISVFFLSGCVFVNSSDKKTHDEIINSIVDVSSEKKVVVSFTNDEKEDAYYVYDLENVGYKQYLYIIHKNSDCYDKYVSEMSGETYYELKKYNDYLTTRITLQVSNSTDDVKNYILSIYENDSNYRIIE